MTENQAVQTGVTQQPGDAAGQGQQPNPQAGTQTQTPAQAPQQNAAPEIPSDLQGAAVQGQDGQVLVPLATALDERKKRQTLESTNKQLKDENFLYQMNTVHGPAQQPAGPQPHGPQGAPGTVQETPATLAVPDELASMADSEVINAGELKKFLAATKLPETTGAAGKSDQQQVQVGRQLLNFMAPDSETVLTQNFVQRLQAEPHLAQFVSGLPAMIRPFVAYRLGKGEGPGQAQHGAMGDMNAATMNPHTQNATPPAAGQTPQDAVNKIVTNAQLPTPTSAVANSGAIDSTKRFAQMTDEQIDAEMERVLNQ